MSFIAKLFSPPKMPAFVMPSVSEVPSYDDKERAAAEKQALLDAEKKRKGRRSTILTSGQGLTTDPDELNTPTLLGG